jgi:hypothetical protein
MILGMHANISITSEKYMAMETLHWCEGNEIRPSQ